MSQTLCEIDDTPIRDSACLCHGCTRHVIIALRQIPELMDDLAVMLTKRSKVPNYGTEPSTSVDEGKPMFYSVAASRAKGDLKAVLVSWARYVHEERTLQLTHGHEYVWAEPRPITVTVPTPLDCEDTVTSISGWLRQHIQWLRRRDIAPDLYREIVGAVNTIRALIDAAPQKQYIGVCGSSRPAPSGSGQVVCRAELWADVGAPEVLCRVCGFTWGVQGRRAGAVARALDQIESAEVIARALSRSGVEITVARIYSWKNRGKITPADFDDRGRAKYRLGDVMDVWHATQADPRNSRRPKEDL